MSNNLVISFFFSNAWSRTSPSPLLNTLVVPSMYMKIHHVKSSPREIKEGTTMLIQRSGSFVIHTMIKDLLVSFSSTEWSSSICETEGPTLFLTRFVNQLTNEGVLKASVTHSVWLLHLSFFFIIIIYFGSSYLIIAISLLRCRSPKFIRGECNQTGTCVVGIGISMFHEICKERTGAGPEYLKGYDSPYALNAPAVFFLYI